MAESTLRADDLLPAPPVDAAESIARPALSYWQDAWVRLKANRRALASLFIVIGLLAFTLLGPMIWRLDPADTDVERASQPPGADRRAQIVGAFEPWSADQGVATPGVGLRLATLATTQAARLTWDPLPGAASHRLYRSPYPPDGEPIAFGLPLFEAPASSEHRHRYFEDRLDLRPSTWFYSLVALDAEGERLSGVHQILEVPVKRVITLENASSRNLARDGQALAEGDVIKLQLHPLGTDYLGRDLLARLMAGARVSFFIGLAAPLLFVGIGVVYGAAAGFLGGRLDQLLMRFSDFVVALPFLLFMILIRVVSGVQPGESGIAPMVIAMVALSWPATARLVRGQILQIREEGYVAAARLLGARSGYVVLRHMIPNTLGVILVTLTFAVPTAIFTEAFLSFIGMGVAPPTPSWGSMCNEGIKTMLTYPHELIFPALFISIAVLAFNLLGDGLRDALDARMRNQG